MSVLNDSRPGTPSNKEFLENDYCYRCNPLCDVDQEKEDRIYSLCTDLEWIRAHNILSGANPSELKEHIQRALTCTKCPPVDNLSKIEKSQAEITVMMRHRGRLEILSVLTEEKKAAESLQKSMREIRGTQINRKPSKIQSSSNSSLTEQTDRSKFCYRCMPLCHDDRMKENDVENSLVLNMNEYVRRLLNMEFCLSKDFNAQETFDNAFRCQNCPKIETPCRKEDMWAQIMVLMRRQGRNATLRKILTINEEAEQAEQDAAATRKARSYDNHTHLRQTYLNLPKQPQEAKRGPLHSASSLTRKVATGVSLTDHLPLQFLVPNTNLEESVEEKLAAGIAALTSYFTNRGSDNKTNEESDFLAISSTSDTNAKERTEGQEIDNGNKTKANEKSSQNALVPVNPDIEQIQDEDHLQPLESTRIQPCSSSSLSPVINSINPKNNGEDEHLQTQNEKINEKQSNMSEEQRKPIGSGRSRQRRKSKQTIERRAVETIFSFTMRKRAHSALPEGTQQKKSLFEMREEKDQSAGSPVDGTHDAKMSTPTNTNLPISLELPVNQTTNPETSFETKTVATPSETSTPDANQNNMNEAAGQVEVAGRATELDEQMEVDPPTDQIEPDVTEKTQKTMDSTDKTLPPQPKTKNEQPVVSSLDEKAVVLEEENTSDSNTEVLKSKEQQTTLESSENVASSSSVPRTILNEEREHDPESDTDAIGSQAAAFSEMHTNTDFTEQDDMQYDDMEYPGTVPEEHLHRQVPEEAGDSHQVSEEADGSTMHDDEAHEALENPVDSDHDDKKPEDEDSGEDSEAESTNDDKDIPSTSEAKTSAVQKQKKKRGGRSNNNKTCREIAEEKRNNRRKANMNKQNTEWLLKQMLTFAYEKRKNDPDYVWKEYEKIRVKGWIKTWAKKSNPKNMPKRTDIELGTELPDRGNYRHCLEYFRRRCTAFETKEFGESSSSSKKATVAPETVRLTGTMHLKHDCSAEDVKNAAVSSPTRNVNPVYKKEELVPPVPNKALLDKERDFYKLGPEDFHLPCPVVHIASMESSEIKKLEQICNGVPVLLIKGLDTAANVDLIKFERKKIPIKRDSEITVLNQVPQPAEHNKNEQGEDTWLIHHREEKIRFGEFLEYLDKVEEKADELYNLIANNKTRGKEKKDSIDRFVDKMIKEQYKPESGDKNSPWSRFGTNLDLTEEDCEHLLEELKKLPEHLRPSSQTNLLSQLECNLFGINRIQMYLKTIGSRTAAHMEHLLMASINWNLGPSPCTWYGISYEYFGEVEKLSAENKANYHHENFYPSEEDLVKRGIPFYKFEQLAKEMVYLNSGFFHYVQSNSNCSNVAWNVGQPTFNQLAISMVAVDHNLQKKNPNIIPLAQIAWSVAKEKKFVDVPDVYQLIRNILIRSLAHMERYFLYIKENKKKCDVDKHGDLSKNRWCVICGCEVFNIVHWAAKKSTKKNKKEFLESFCSGCTPPKGYVFDKVEFTYKQTLEELRGILDGYRSVE